MNQPQRIKGILSPVVTPFSRDLSPDPQRFIAQCQWLLSQNCGLAVFGPNSEANSLSVNPRRTIRTGKDCGRRPGSWGILHVWTCTLVPRLRFLMLRDGRLSRELPHPKPPS